MRHLIVAAVLLRAAAAAAQPFAFTPLTPIELAVGDDAGPQAVALADVSGDGMTDLVVVGRDDDVLFVLLGDGAGGFQDPVVYELDVTPSAVAVADVASPFASETAGDVDGAVDIIVAGDDGYAEILLGRGDGSFDPPEQDLSDVLDGLELIAVEVRDLDGNGRLDLIFLDAFDEVYFQCNEHGVFAPCATDFVETGGEGAIDFAVIDFDTDGQLDVAVVSVDSHDVRITRGLGGGAFEEAPTYVLVDSAGQHTPAALAAADLDDVASEKLIVASAPSAENGVAVISYDVPDPLVSLYAGVADPRAIAVADYNLDSAPDLAILSGATPALTVASGDGSGGFTSPQQAAGAASIGAGRTLVAGLIDDGPRPDLAIVNEAGDAVLIARNVSGSPPLCVGDCDPDRTVVINELIIGVNIALGFQPVAECSAFDRDESNSVEIDELITAVRNALEGCP
jgi:hypothetical protein